MWIFREVVFSLNVAPESSGTGDHQERSGPGLPESSEGLWSWGPCCCSQQSQRLVHGCTLINKYECLVETCRKMCELHRSNWAMLWQLYAVPYFTESGLFSLLEFCENLPEDNREQIIMTHILPCVKVKKPKKTFLSAPLWHFSGTSHFSWT